MRRIEPYELWMKYRPVLRWRRPAGEFVRQNGARGV